MTVVIGHWEVNDAPCFRINLTCIRCGRVLYRRVVDREPELGVRCAGCGDDERGCVCPSARQRCIHGFENCGWQCR